MRAEEGEHNYDLLFNLLNKINRLNEMKNKLLLIMCPIGSTVNAVIPVLCKHDNSINIPNNSAGPFLSLLLQSRAELLITCSSI